MGEGKERRGFSTMGILHILLYIYKSMGFVLSDGKLGFN
jgi:hypothetical protein